MKYLSKSGRTFDSETLCLRDENFFLMEELKKYTDTSLKDKSVLTIDKRNLNLSEIEKVCILAALIKHGYNRGKASRELGISDRTIYRKMIDYNIKEMM